MYGCLAYLYVCVPGVCPVPSEASKGHQIPRTGVIDGRDLPYERWEWNSGPLQEQQVLLTPYLFL